MVCRLSLALFAVLALSPAGAGAQANPAGLPELTGAQDERVRMEQILGRRPTDGYLLRSTSSLVTPMAADSADEGSPRPRVRGILPSARVVWNSRIPYTVNDGALWAGRGVSSAVSSGVRMELGRVRLILAPELLRMQNEPFQTFGGRDSTRSGFSSPWYAADRSADLPLRFGREPLTMLDWGQSSLTAAMGPVDVGLATENQWWGPGIRNAIVLSNQAGGFPHAFVRTSHPIGTPLGDVEAKWVLGGLSESIYFNDPGDRQTRSFNGVVATLRPAAPLTLGIARAVYDDTEASRIPGHLLDFLIRRGAIADEGDDAPTRGADQITSLFGRWVLPGDRAEVYAEWARSALPSSLRDFIEAPNHSQGYTLGVQWAHPVATGGAVRLQGELTYLELSPTVRYRRAPTFYTSSTVPQGYTHRGQVLGAAVGPGSSGQWAAVDYFAPRWQLGVYAARTRWDEDAHNLIPRPPVEKRRSPSHDVSLHIGARGSARIRGWNVSADLGVAERLNYLFQNPDFPYDIPVPASAVVDVRNTTLRLAVSPFMR